MQILLTPPIALLVYVLLAGSLSLAGNKWAGHPRNGSAAKASTYSSGEAPPVGQAAPGYRPFFVVALFFAILHLGILVVSTGEPSPIMVVYLFGLAAALLALILG
jgi:NADH:ubiquinone oxidoreductase subunit 3 (subunit A)